MQPIWDTKRSATVSVGRGSPNSVTALQDFRWETAENSKVAVGTSLGEVTAKKKKVAGSMLEHLCPESQINYARDFSLTNQAIARGRVAATSYKRESFCTKW